VINIGTIILLRRKIAKAKRSPESNIPGILKKLQATKLKMMAAVSLVFAISWLVTTLVLSSLSNVNFSATKMMKVGPLVGSLFNLIVYLITSTDFRKGFVRIILQCKSLNTVEPLRNQTAAHPLNIHVEPRTQEAGANGFEEIYELSVHVPE
jgi:hypothetical protein